MPIYFPFLPLNRHNYINANNHCPTPSILNIIMTGHATNKICSKKLCYFIISKLKYKLITLTKFSSMTKSPISSVITSNWLWASWSERNSQSLKNVGGRVHNLLWLRFSRVNLVRHPNSAGMLSTLLLCSCMQEICKYDKSGVV